MTGDTHSPEQRLARQGLTLPDPPAAVAAFAPYVRSGSTVYVSGQIAVRAGHLVTKGRLGADVGVGDGASRLFLDVLGEAGAHARSDDWRCRAAAGNPGRGRGHRRTRLLMEGII